MSLRTLFSNWKIKKIIFNAQLFLNLFVNSNPLNNSGTGSIHVLLYKNLNNERSN